jgi:hypothetical protein
MDTALLIENLVSPITLAFLLGMIATAVRSDLEIPEPVIRIFAIFLLLSIGLQGGRELAGVTWAEVAGGLFAVTGIIIGLPVLAFFVARLGLRLSIPDAAGVAALYGSVSSVTFVVAQSMAEAAGIPAAGFVTALVALVELGILVALFCGRIALARTGTTAGRLWPILAETLRGRGLLLLGGGLIMGAAMGERNFARIEPFFVDLFRGVLVLFLLEMGMTAARHIRGFLRVGPQMVVFGLVMPLVNGTIGAGLATLAGMGQGSAFVLGAVAASASYIDAPAAVRATFPQANPGVYLTASLGVTFPFMMIAGLPIVWQIAAFWQGLATG